MKCSMLLLRTHFGDSHFDVGIVTLSELYRFWDGLMTSFPQVFCLLYRYVVFLYPNRVEESQFLNKWSCVGPSDLNNQLSPWNSSHLFSSDETSKPKKEV